MGSKFPSRDPLIRTALIVFIVLAVTVGGVFSYYYVYYDRNIDQFFKGQVFNNSAKIYAIPRVFASAKKSTQGNRCPTAAGSYSDKDGDSVMGSYRLLKDGIEVDPGPAVLSQPGAGDHSRDRRAS